MIGREHLRFVRQSQRCELVAIADPSPDAAILANDLGVPDFESHDAMLDTVRPDGVILAVPNDQHKATALACISRGIPALLEKPIADNVASAAEVVRRSQESSVPILIGHHRRHSPDMVTARKLVRDGVLGRPTAANGMWMSRKPPEYFANEWRRHPGGGPFLINLIHEIDCLRFLFGEISTVHAMTANEVRGFDTEDTGAIAFRFENGALGTFTISDAVPSPWIWDVASGQGAYFPFTYGDCYFLGGTDASLAVPSMRLHWHGDGDNWQQPTVSKTVPTPRTNCYVNQLDHFIDRKSVV